MTSLRSPQFLTATAVAVVLTWTSPQAMGQAAGRPGSITLEESAVLSEGWTFMLNQRYADAHTVARSAAARFPGSIAVLSLGVESAIGAQGPLPALDFYETWQTNSRAEQLGVLRRVARAVLYQWAFQRGETESRLAALKALKQEGEEPALQALMAKALEGSLQDVAALAALGHEQALDRLIERMETVPGSKLQDVRMIAASGNVRAVPTLSRLLSDPLPENRVAAASALGTLGDPAARAVLIQALNDAHGGVKLEAAGALLKLKDTSGLPILLDLAESESVSARRSAAWLLSADPNERWLRLVRSLAGERDPLVQLDAATLLLPHDPAFARPILDRLRGDANPAIREATDQVVAGASTTDFASLRSLLRSGNGLIAVAAGSRLMMLTR